MRSLRFSWIGPEEEMIIGFVYNPNLILVYPPEKEGEDEKVDLTQMLSLGGLFFRIDLILNK